MAKIKEREMAQSLRITGLSINDIAEKLSVAKSTVSHWCRDIFLSETAIKRISQKSHAKSTTALLKYSEAKRYARLQATEQSFATGSKRLGKLNKRDIYCIGLGIYWGEGYRRGNQEFGFTNSDVEMIKFYIVWLSKVFNIKKDRLILRVSVNNAHKKRIRDIETFWSKEIGIPLSQFSKSSLIKTASKNKYDVPENHFGTLRVKVRRGTILRREILGSIAAISKNLP